MEILISERGEKVTEKENSTLIPGFSVHMDTQAHFLTLSNTLSHHPNTQEECVCVCV